uniref:Uncharacterized protein n=1 Tax=Glossina austeni TaxID=7395 RepID=A0A1A9V787_GLOAU
MQSTLRTSHGGNIISIDKPQMVLDYTANMGGVDLAATIVMFNSVMGNMVVVSKVLTLLVVLAIATVTARVSGSSNGYTSLILGLICTTVGIFLLILLSLLLSKRQRFANSMGCFKSIL